MKVHYCACGKLIEYHIQERVFLFFKGENYVCRTCLQYKKVLPSRVFWSIKLTKEGQKDNPEPLKWKE